MQINRFSDKTIDDIQILLKYLISFEKGTKNIVLEQECISRNFLNTYGMPTAECRDLIFFLQSDILQNSVDLFADLISVDVDEIIGHAKTYFENYENRCENKDDGITNLQNKDDGIVGKENILPSLVGKENILPSLVESKILKDGITNLQNKDDGITNLQNKDDGIVGKRLIKKHALKLLNDLKSLADNLRQDGDKRRFTKNAFNNILIDLLTTNCFDLRNVENNPVKYGKLGTYKSDLSVLNNHLSWIYSENTGLYVLNEEKFYKNLSKAQIIDKAVMIERSEENRIEQAKKDPNDLTEFSKSVENEYKNITQNTLETGYLRYNFNSESVTKLLVSHHLLENTREYLEKLQDNYFEKWVKTREDKLKSVLQYPLLKYEFENIPIVAREYIQYPNDRKLGKLITIEAEILETTALKNMTYSAEYLSNTGRTKRVKIDRHDKKIPENMRETIYDDVGTPEEIKWELLCKYRIPYQELLVQQPLDLLDSLVSPKPIKCIWKGSEGLFEESCGKVRITGILDIDKSDVPVTPYIIDILQIESLEEFSAQSLAQEDINKAVEYFSKRNVGSISNELIPKIKGQEYDLLKKAVLFQQCNVQDRNGDNNDNIHILMVTDPGMGKSVILSRISGLFVNNQYADMSNATQAGIAAALEKQEGLLGSSWVVVRGALPRSHCGTACLDEKPGKNTPNIKYINESMQNGRITITKAKTSELPANMAVLWGCNPKYEKLDPNASIIEQIEFPESTLSRFDIIWVKEDKPNAKNDREAIRAMLKKNEEIYKDVDEEGLKRYILYARSLKPVLTETVENEIVNYIVSRRARNNINKRAAATILKLATASAKANLRTEITPSDYREAIEIYEYFLDTVLRDPTTGLYDQGKIAGVPQSRLDKMDKIKKVIIKLSETSINGLADVEDVIEEVKQYNISEDETLDLLEKLKKSAEIFSPKTGYYKLI